MPVVCPERRRMVETRVGKERFQGSAQRKSRYSRGPKITRRRNNPDKDRCRRLSRREIVSLKLLN